MRAKEGRDYLKFNDCLAKTTESGSVILFTIDSRLELTAKEFSTLVKFIEKQNKQKLKDQNEQHL